MKCKQIELRFNRHNKFPFFRKGSPSNQCFVLMLQNDHFEMPSWIHFVLVQFEVPVLIKFITKICYSKFLFQFWN